MERKIEIPDFREDDDATIEDAEPAMSAFSSSELSQDWEKISEDWVSLFLDSTILDDHSRSLSTNLENYLQFDSILLETNDHFCSEDLVADSLLLHSTDDQLPRSSMALRSSLNVIEGMFGKEDSSLQVDLIPSERKPFGQSISASPTSNLTWITDGSSLGMEVVLWKDKEANPNLLIMLEQEMNAKVSSTSKSPTFLSSVAIGLKSEFTNITSLTNNPLQSSSCLLQCEEGEIGSRDVGHEVVSSSDSIAWRETSSTISHLEICNSIGSTIIVGLLKRTGNMGINDEDRKNCKAKSSKLQSQEISKDQQSDCSDGDMKEEGGDEDNEKQDAWLMRNCESARFSRQRKKVYINESEDKLQIVDATIAELNATISHLKAENENLQRQLGYYFLAPSICLRPRMPMHIMPIGLYSGIVAGRLMYPGGQMPYVPISRIQTQISGCTSRRPKPKTTKKKDKKQTKLKAVGIASIAIVGLLCVAVLFGSFDKGINGSNGIDDYIQIENVQVEGPVLTSWNEGANPLNITRLSLWDSGVGWRPLKPRKYGPERKRVPSVHIQLAANKPQYRKNEKLQGITKVEFESSIWNSIKVEMQFFQLPNSPDYFNSIKTPLLMESDAVPPNTSQFFAASMFIPGANDLVKDNGNLTIQVVMVGDKETRKLRKKHYEKKCKSGSKKKKERKQSTRASSKLQVSLKSLSIKALDNLASKEPKLLKNATTRSFVTARHLSRNVNSVVKANNSILSLLPKGSLQQWILNSLHDLEINFVASKLTKKIRSQLSMDNLEIIATTQETFYSFIPYDATLRRPLHLWLFLGLSTEPIMCKKNTSDNIKDALPLPIENEKRFETLMPFWAALQPLAYNQLFQKKLHKKDICSVPTLSKLFWASTNNELAKAESRQCLARLMLNTSMCMELFQFDTIANTSQGQASSLEAKNMAKLVAAKVVHGSLHNVTSTLSVHVLPFSRRDPFAIPPMKPKPLADMLEEGFDGTDSRVEKIAREQMDSQNLRYDVTSMAVSVMVGQKEHANSRRKGANGLSRIFIVVLVNNQKYMTYLCMLPFSGPQIHVTAE